MGGLLALALLGPAAGVAAAAPVDDVPVAGSFDFSPNRSAQDGQLRGVVNAVRRIDGGTVVYWSIGLPQGAKDVVVGPQTLNDISVLDKSGYRPGDVFNVDVIDPVGLKRYRPMVSGDACLCSRYQDFEVSSFAPGTLYAGYAVVPPLPASVTSVSVMAFGAAVSDVQVGDGALTPVSPQGKGIVELTTGWPTVPTDAIAAVGNPGSFILPLQERTSDLEKTVRKTETPTKVTVDLAADVLFATDSAKLSPRAASKIDAVGKDIAARGTGTVTVTGYTDSTGSPAHNLVLSRQRADAVLAALKPVAGGDVTFEAAGRGEADPVATNATAQGRQENRRVTITYSVKGK
ncbi:OmpA family protein [Angustibacter luteus]|uniref:OmpA family protein n=1 Tax=Angustibacter luteus TaxID=658456 RepID=A0ABW1J9Z4_9ACTN